VLSLPDPVKWTEKNRRIGDKSAVRLLHAQKERTGVPPPLLLDYHPISFRAQVRQLT